jgi:flagellar biosynthesis/type III secretory pathway protein FliH
MSKPEHDAEVEAIVLRMQQEWYASPNRPPHTIRAQEDLAKSVRRAVQAALELGQTELVEVIQEAQTAEAFAAGKAEGYREGLTAGRDEAFAECEAVARMAIDVPETRDGRETALYIAELIALQRRGRGEPAPRDGGDPDGE